MAGLMNRAALVAAMMVPVSAQAQDAAPVAEARRVDILRYRIEGNTVLPRVPVERAVMPYLGKQRALDDIESARAALEALYRKNGYEAVSVEIPQQDVRGGVVTIKVVELTVGELRVVNAKHFSPRSIEKRVPALAEGQTPNYNDVARELSLLNRTADRTVTPTLRAGVAPDTVDVDLNVEDKLPLHGSIEINDRQSARTKRARVSGSLSYGDLWGLEHSVNVQGQFAPRAPDESWVVSASYVAPLQGTPFTLLAYGVHSRSDVTAVGGINVLGSGDVVGLRALYNTNTGTGADQWFHQFTLGLDYKNFRENLIVFDEDDPDEALAALTPIDYVPLTGQYSAVQRTERYDFSLSATLTAGIRSLSSGNIDFRRKRYNASPSWMHLRADADLLYRLGRDWQLGIKLAGQLSPSYLIANEQFAVGGLDSVRGYYESQELGDQGLSGQIQVTAPALSSKNLAFIDDMRLFSFLDGGAVWYRGTLDGQDGFSRIGSAGAGVTFRLFDRVHSSTSLAVPFVHRSSVPTDIADAVRVQMRLWANF